MAKIVRFHKLGGPEVLQIEDVPLAELGEGEVRLQVKAIGLNRAEVIFREGMYLETPTFPARIGYEASGIVDAVGPGVNNIRVGDKVSTLTAFKMSKYGVYGETAVVPAHAVAHYPDNLSFEEGASIWMQYLTAYGVLIEYGQIKPKHYVLITAATSSVGCAAILITKAAGTVAIATTRNPAKKQMLLNSGADYVIVANEEDLPTRVIEITSGHGADLIFDPIAGLFVEKLAAAAAPSATIFIYGFLSMDITTTPFPLIPALSKGLKLQGYTVFELTQNPEKRERGIHYVYNGLKSGILKPAIDTHIFSLDNIVEAHRYIESNQQNGKIIVTV